MNIYTIYRITNILNGKIYIGWTSRDPEIRFEEHSRGKKSSIIGSAIEKYGRENFKFEILYQTKDEIHSKEMEGYFILGNNSLLAEEGGWGYNIDKGGKGHKRSKRTIELHRHKLTGRKQSEDHKRKKSNAIKGKNNGMYNIGENHPRYGYSLSDTEKQNISMGRKYQIARDKENGTYIHFNPMLNDQSIEKMKNTKLSQRKDKSKFIEIVIQEPSGNIITLDWNYHDYFLRNNLNNFMAKQIRDNSKPIKGFRLISYKLRCE